MSIDKAISGKKVLEYIENNPEADGFWNGEKSRVAFDFLTDAINEGRLAFDIITPTYGAINKLLIVTELERDIESHLRQGFHDVAHMLETYKETILEGSFDIIPTDVCQTCHGVGEITLTVGRKPDEFENVDCPDCPDVEPGIVVGYNFKADQEAEDSRWKSAADVDVKEIEGRINGIISVVSMAGGSGESIDAWSLASEIADIGSQLLTKYTETLAQVERLQAEVDHQRDRKYVRMREREVYREKLNQAVEALERIESLGCYTNGTTEADIAREALESIKGSDPNASN